MFTVLDTKIFDLYVRSKWEGWIELNSNIFEGSTSYQLLKNQDGVMTNRGMFKRLTDDIFNNDNGKDQVHGFKFEVFKFSMNSRFMLECFFILFLTLLFQLYIT